MTDTHHHWPTSSGPRQPYAQLLACDLIEEALPDSIAAEAEAEVAKLDLPTVDEPTDEKTDEEPIYAPETRVPVGAGAGSQEPGNAITGDLSKVAGYHVESMVELAGLEPATSWVRSRRSPN